MQKVKNLEVKVVHSTGIKLGYYAAIKGNNANMILNKECYAFTFNKHVVLDSQKRKTNHLNNMSRSSITSFQLEGSACTVATASKQEKSQEQTVWNHSNEEMK